MRIRAMATWVFFGCFLRRGNVETLRKELGFPNFGFAVFDFKKIPWLLRQKRRISLV